MFTTVVAFLTLSLHISGTISAEQSFLTALTISDNSESLAGKSAWEEYPSEPLRLLRTPNISTTYNYKGYDWTEPYPGQEVNGHQIHFRVAYDVPIPETLGKNSSTAITSITYSVPDSMMAKDDEAKSIHPSWYICRTVWVSLHRNVPASLKKDGSCDYLPNECIATLQKRLVHDWMEQKTHSCSVPSGAALPESCMKDFGIGTAWTLGPSNPLIKCIHIY
jgi:hypothetical protein